MHIHELNPKRTVITMVIFVVVIIVGLLTLTNPRLKYELTPEQTVLLSVSDDGGITPEKLDNILVSPTIDAEIIDIRNRDEFTKGHIPGVKNISAVELLKDDNIKWLKNLQENGYVVIIYGEDQIQANGPWMVLQQIGLDNVNVLCGGYQNYLAYKNKEATTYSPGKAEFDYAEVAKTSSVGSENGNINAKKTTIVRRKKKGGAVAGGC
jgi:3-mercaptopyruvate sulfurtransferase SseA